MNTDDNVTPGTNANVTPVIDLTSAGIDYDPETDTFALSGSSQSFGSQVEFDGGEGDDEDENSGGSEDDVEEDEDTPVSTYKKT
jgi:hypothetical protein